MARPMRNPFFKCPTCDALYQVVKAEAGPKTSDREIECLVCGAPFAARDDEFVLKYFLLRTANRKKRSWQRRALLADTQEPAG
jgi:hypothetical protein